MSAPSVYGVSRSNMIELVGLLPGKTLCGASSLISASDMPPFALNSARTSSSDLPFIRASVCAKKLESRMVWCSPIGFCV